MATVVATLSMCAGVAGAASGGGVGAPDPPKVTDVQCIETCGGLRKATTNSKVSLNGRHMSHVVAVRFDQEGGGKIEVEPTQTGRRSVKARVPEGAKTGEPTAVDSTDKTSTSPRRLQVVDPEEIPDDGGWKLDKARATPGKAFWGAKRKAHVAYTFEGSPTDVRIDVVNSKSGKVISSWVQRNRQPYVRNDARWDGRRDGGGEPPIGRYKFQIGPVTGGKTQSTHGSHFGFYDHVFPVRGRHQYWDGFGAPRSGHTHQGQDVGARCGTKIVSPRAGRVQWKAYQSAAGNYVVIDAKRDDHDYMFAHLKRPASVRKGENVRTGEKIGIVGSTGDASGCHLHFEYWKNDWYNGGRALPKVTRVLEVG